MQLATDSFLTSDPVDSFLKVAKISCQALEMLTKVLRLQIFIFISYVYYVMYAKIV